MVSCQRPVLMPEMVSTKEACSRPSRPMLLASAAADVLIVSDRLRGATRSGCCRTPRSSTELIRKEGLWTCAKRVPTGCAGGQGVEGVKRKCGGGGGGDGTRREGEGGPTSGADSSVKTANGGSTLSACPKSCAREGEGINKKKRGRRA